MSLNGPYTLGTMSGWSGKAKKAVRDVREVTVNTIVQTDPDIARPAIICKDDARVPFTLTTHVVTHIRIAALHLHCLATAGAAVGTGASPTLREHLTVHTVRLALVSAL